MFRAQRSTIFVIHISDSWTLILTVYVESILLTNCNVLSDIVGKFTTDISFQNFTQSPVDCCDCEDRKLFQKLSENKSRIFFSSLFQNLEMYSEKTVLRILCAFHIF